MYDVIVVGARAAGASTALLLARRGLKVLCVDKAKFPCDTLSTHQIQVPGIAKLKRWGLLDSIIAADTPATRDVKLDTGTVVLEGRFPPSEGADALYGPRRTILDKILVDSARNSGAELREDFFVEGLSFTDRCVAEVRGRTRNGRAVIETALLVVGADGKRSLVAKAVNAETLFETPTLTAAYYGYWEGRHLQRAEIYERHRRAIGVWPTNDGLTVIYIALPIGEFHEFQSDVAANVSKTLDQAGDLGERVRAAKQVGRIMGSANLPNWVRKAHGPGWALVGDAGFVMDPLTAQGMSQAFSDAELLAHAIESGLDGKRSVDQALQDYEKERNRRGLPMYKLTTQRAVLGPRPCELEVLYESLQGDQTEIDRLFGLLSGAISVRDYLSPLHLLRILRPRGIARIVASKVFRSGTCHAEA
jgi:2-polyprenyl-6-methoxyphenol hydroxylase-like FAD-dependent oxidoreductase